MALLLEAKAKANRRPRYILGLKQYLGSLVRALGANARLHRITPEQLESFLFRGHPAASTASANRARLSSFYNFSKRRGWLRHSPVDALDTITVEPSIPRIYRAGQVRALFDEAVRQRSTRRVLPAMVLGFWGGVRPEEVLHLHWQDVRATPEGGVVVVSHAKNRDRRLVPLSPNAGQWMLWSHDHDGELPPHGNIKRTLRGLRRRVGIPSIQDGARHTAATMMHARGDEPHKITRALGNSTRILFSNYVDALAVGPEEAAAFWNILPPAQQHQLMLALG